MFIRVTRHVYDLLDGDAGFNTPGGIEPEMGDLKFQIQSVENANEKRGSGFGVLNGKYVVFNAAHRRFGGGAWLLKKTRFQIQGVETAKCKRGSIFRVLIWQITNLASPSSRFLCEVFNGAKSMAKSKHFIAR